MGSNEIAVITILHTRLCENNFESEKGLGEGEGWSQS